MLCIGAKVEEAVYAGEGGAEGSFIHLSSPNVRLSNHYCARTDDKTVADFGEGEAALKPSPSVYGIRRRSVLGGATAVLAAPMPARSVEPVTLGLTPVVVESDLALLAAMEKELSARIGAPVVLMKRRTYQEITALLLAGQITAAWICGFPFIRHRDQLSILAAPIYDGAPLYRSYFIAPADAPGAVWQDFRGRMHAFSDPDSNSGWLVTTHMLAMAETTPDAFFSRTFFTYGHRNVVRAVAAGLADCGSVDGYVWDVLAEREPALTARTRIVRRSEWLGFPPVASPQA